MDLNAIDLWGMAVMGEIFSTGGILSFISSQRKMCACPEATFSLASAAKCLIALGLVADLWGPRLIATMSWAFVHCCRSLQDSPSVTIQPAVGRLDRMLPG
jgi:hypothetical protein